MGENFSGSCTVTSRNLLIHIGATTATKSGCFDPKGVHQGLLSGGWRCVEESLATANFGEFHFLRTRVNRALGEAIMLSRTKAEEAPGEQARTCGRQGGAGDGR
jgi:hypothetical protein